MEEFDFTSLPPEVLEAILASGELQGQQGILQDQMAQAQALRNKPSPKGTYTGQTYVASNPLQHLSGALEKRRAGKEIKDLRERQKDLLEQQTFGTQSFIDLLRGRPDQAYSSASTRLAGKKF